MSLVLNHFAEEKEKKGLKDQDFQQLLELLKLSNNHLDIAKLKNLFSQIPNFE
jgi:hypothetical protein